MTTKLVVTADLGLLRAYRWVQGRTDRTPHLELMDELRPLSAHQKASEQMSDEPGRFSKGRGPGDVPGDLSAGEQHDLELEQRRRLIKLLAATINTWLADQNIGARFLAASAPIHGQLLEQLDASARSKVATTLALDLTKSNPADLLNRFRGDG